MFRQGIEQELKMKPEEEMEQQSLQRGSRFESGEVVDMTAYEAWQQENHRWTSSSRCSVEYGEHYCGIEREDVSREMIS